MALPLSPATPHLTVSPDAGEEAWEFILSHFVKLGSFFDITLTSGAYLGACRILGLAKDVDGALLVTVIPMNDEGEPLPASTVRLENVQTFEYC